LEWRGAAAWRPLQRISRMHNPNSHPVSEVSCPVTFFLKRNAAQP